MKKALVALRKIKYSLKRRPKLLATLYIIGALVAFGGAAYARVFYEQYKNNKQTVINHDKTSVSVSDTSGNPGVIGKAETRVVSIEVSSLLTETNTNREKNNIKALTLSPQLNSSASAKCKDMIGKDYWAHNDPTGKEPWHFFTEAGYSYTTAGENLAYGFASSQDVVTGWMNSPKHRDNILNGKFTEVGYGICTGDNYIGRGKQTVVVQHFAAPYIAVKHTPAPVPKPYVASVCTKVPIPFKTVYADASYLYVGETKSYSEGVNGYTNTCTADSTGYKPADYTIQPYDKTVYVGTKPKPADPTPPPTQ